MNCPRMWYGLTAKGATISMRHKPKAPERIPAKSIEDFMLDEKCYKGDFDIQSRWDSAVTELERLSLLGIAAYGFLISGMGLEKDSTSPFFVKLQAHPHLPVIGILCFAMAASCALVCNVLSCKCMRWQIDILRAFERYGSDRWGETEKTKILNWARYLQGQQKEQLLWNRGLLASSTIFLAAGAVATALTFAAILL